ncbi:uncharacterized protein RAG0_14401 [Rhynchosporium agropyri]|uniref:SAP domain-containing protein n=1 Tax=Rhynchosporium agropyri TaxID=914238 RepID=A0A1E1LGU6_9HELO|nr:uncharacterized protein RAG0_14401 [Rhynchosporium agropyri]
MDRYDRWTEDKLRQECIERKLRCDGVKSKLAKRIADHDEVTQYAEPHPVFDRDSDLKGNKEATYLDSQAEFDENYWNSVLGSELEFFETMVESKKTELADTLKNIEVEYDAAMNKKDARVASYEDASASSGQVAETSSRSASPNLSLEISSLMDESSAIVQSSPEPTHEVLTKKLSPTPCIHQPEITSIAKPQPAGAAVSVLAPTSKKAYLPMPLAEYAFNKAPPSNGGRQAGAKKAIPSAAPKTAPTTGVTENGAIASVVKNVYLPMPKIESAFHKTPLPKDARKTQVKKAAPGLVSKSALTKSTESGTVVPFTKKAYFPMPKIESAFHKISLPKAGRKAHTTKAPAKPEPKSLSKKTTTESGAAPAADKVYKSMSKIESAFHKTPPPKSTRKGRAKKPAPEPEPKPEPRKFMTEAGIKYLKEHSIDSKKITEYEKLVEDPSNLKRPSLETEASKAKKLRLDPEEVIKPDRDHARVEEDSVQACLINVGYLYLPCEDEKKVRGDSLPYLSYQYRAFAITDFRADKNGYFMVFEKTIKGDRDLKKCLELIDMEIAEKTFFDKNVTDVKMSKRDDAEEELEAESESETEPGREGVELGYTHVPYKNVPSQSRWGRRYGYQ